MFWLLLMWYVDLEKEMKLQTKLQYNYESMSQVKLEKDIVAGIRE